MPHGGRGSIRGSTHVRRLSLREHVGVDAPETVDTNAQRKEEKKKLLMSEKQKDSNFHKRFKI